MAEQDYDLDTLVRLLQIPPRKRSEQIIEQIKGQTKYFQFFRSPLGGVDLDEVTGECCQYMHYERMSEGEYVFKIHQEGDKFYIILSGTVGIYLKPVYEDESKRRQGLVHDKTLTAGQSFGEMALIYDSRRMATIQCLTNCDFAILQKEDFQRILLQKQRERVQKAIEFLYKVAVLQELPYQNVQDLVLTSTSAAFQRGQAVFSEGDSVDAVYIVKEGRFTQLRNFEVARLQCKNPVDQSETYKKFNILCQNGNRLKLQQPINYLEVYDLFGEEDLLQNCERTFTVICDSGVGKLIKISRADFIKRIMDNSQPCFKVIKVFEQKMNFLTERIASLIDSMDGFASLKLTDRRLMRPIAPSGIIARSDQSGSSRSPQALQLIFKKYFDDAQQVINPLLQDSIIKEQQLKRQNAIMKKKLNKKKKIKEKEIEEVPTHKDQSPPPRTNELKQVETPPPIHIPLTRPPSPLNIKAGKIYIPLSRSYTIERVMSDSLIRRISSINPKHYQEGKIIYDNYLEHTRITPDGEDTPLSLYDRVTRFGYNSKTALCSPKSLVNMERGSSGQSFSSFSEELRTKLNQVAQTASTFRQRIPSHPRLSHQQSVSITNLRAIDSQFNEGQAQTPKTFQQPKVLYHALSYQRKQHVQKKILRSLPIIKA